MTMDYAGSFDKEEVVDYMVTNHDFHCQGADDEATKTILDNSHKVGWLVGFVALRPKSTAMVIGGRSVHLTTLFPGQA